jgi:hypothetical protein
MTAYVPITIPVYDSPQENTAAEENLMRSGAPHLSESHIEDSAQDDKSVVSFEDDPAEHSPAAGDPEGATIGADSPVPPSGYVSPVSPTLSPPALPPLVRACVHASPSPALLPSLGAAPPDSDQQAPPHDCPTGSSAPDVSIDVSAASQAPPPKSRTRLQKGIQKPKKIYRWYYSLWSIFIYRRTS